MQYTAARINVTYQVKTCGRKPPIEAGDGDYSNEIGKKIIEEYENFYGEDFPLDKIGTGNNYLQIELFFAFN